jgi:hypothetical protein
MKKIALIIAVLALVLPLSAATTWGNRPLMDAGCAAKKDVLANPDKHTRSCALQCEKNGYGLVVDGKFVKFDDKGNKLAKEALMKSKSKDHLRATVTGEEKDGVIHVATLTLEQ